ncbi:MAG: hypothetical protein JXR56_07330, partial [Candidatus Cloacimonetes bacterium]|nr:hypothetical protein [Candidatus Cloacimonadota bacterium]
MKRKLFLATVLTAWVFTFLHGFKNISSESFGDNITLHFSEVQELQTLQERSFLVQIPDKGKISWNYDIIFTNGIRETHSPDSIFLQVSSPVILRDIRVVSVTLTDLINNESIEEIDLHISALQRNLGINETRRLANPTVSFDSYYQRNVVNYASPRALTHDKVMFVYPQSVESIILTLGNWKERNGFEVEYLAVTPENNTTTWIMDQLIESNNSDNPPSYLILFGDVDGVFAIPTFYYEYPTGVAEGDHQYALLEGEDIVEDIAVGRISFSTESELLTIINKIVLYESM